MKNYCIFRRCLFLFLLAILIPATSTVWSQGSPRNLRVVENCEESVELTWEGAEGDGEYEIWDYSAGRTITRTEETSTVLEGLRERGGYSIEVSTSNSPPFGDVGTVHFIARKESCDPSAPQVEPIFDCAERPDRVLINGLGNGTNCQTVGASGVGVPSLVAQGVIDAVDIWGRDSNVEVCFHNHGMLKFLDAATSPRQVMDLAALKVNGMTCGRIDRAGTVVLLQAADITAPQVESAPAPVAAESAAPVEPTETDPVAGCQLMTTGYVSLRVGPSVNYARLDVVPPNRRLAAIGRSEAWYRVAYAGQTGWISAEYADASGECDSVSESVTIVLPPSTPEEAQMQDTEAATPTEDAPLVPAGRMGAAMTNCRLRTGDIINLRGGPGLDHAVILEIPFLTDLTATDRSWDWFQVEYQGETGWVNIKVVFRNGDCG